MTEAVALQQPPSDKGKRLKLFYITQVAVKPPTFVIFVNDRELMHFSYTRYLENKIREAFGFRGTGLRFLIGKGRESNKMIRLVCVAVGYIFGLFQTSYLYGRMKGMISGSMEAGTREPRTPFGPWAGRQEPLPSWATALNAYSPCFWCVFFLTGFIG